MADFAYDKLSCEELRELVITQQRQINELRGQLAVRQAAEAGSPAEAEEQLRQILQTAQQTADCYLEEAEQRKARQEAEYYLRLAEAARQADAMLLDTERQCRAMLARAAEKSDFYQRALQQRIETLLRENAEQISVLREEKPQQEDRQGFGPDD